MYYQVLYKERYKIWKIESEEPSTSRLDIDASNEHTHNINYWY